MNLPDHDQQIVQTHAAFICQVVEFGHKPEFRTQLEALLKQAADSGWTALVGAVRQMIAGQRDLSLLAGLDDEDHIIAEAILRGLQDPSTLPDPHQKPDPTLAAPGLAHMIHAAGSGNVQALTLISQMAEQMSKAGGDMARIAGIIRPMINGERDPDKLIANMDARGGQLTLQILDELGKLDIH